MTSFSTLHSKIDALGRLIAKDSISPTYLASLLDEMVVLMESIDMSGMSADISNAVTNAREAIKKASDAVNTATNADSTAKAAQQLALSAIEKADNAVKKADEAKSQAANAQGNANIAVSTAEAANANVQDLTDSIGMPNGIVPLNSQGVIPSEFMPGYVDDVLEFHSILDNVALQQMSSIKKSSDPGCMVFYNKASEQFVLGVHTPRTMSTMASSVSSAKDNLLQIQDHAQFISNLNASNLSSLEFVEIITSAYVFYSNWADRHLYMDNSFVPLGGKVYLSTSGNATYRWSGSTLAPIGSDLALGYKEGTAYPGNEGAANSAMLNGINILQFALIAPSLEDLAPQYYDDEREIGSVIYCSSNRYFYRIVREDGADKSTLERAADYMTGNLPNVSVIYRRSYPAGLFRYNSERGNLEEFVDTSTLSRSLTSLEKHKSFALWINVNEFVDSNEPLYNLSNALNAIPEEYRISGVVLHFLADEDGNWETWYWKGNSWDESLKWGNTKAWSKLSGSGAQTGNVVNVNELSPKSDGYYSRGTAANAVPEDLRTGGRIITFMSAANTWQLWQFVGVTAENWLDENYWAQTVKGVSFNGSDPITPDKEGVINLNYKVDVDQQLNPESENPISNKAVAAQISEVDRRIPGGLLVSGQQLSILDGTGEPYSTVTLPAGGGGTTNPSAVEIKINSGMQDTIKEGDDYFVAFEWRHYNINTNVDTQYGGRVEIIVNGSSVYAQEVTQGLVSLPVSPWLSVGQNSVVVKITADDGVVQQSPRIKPTVVTLNISSGYGIATITEKGSPISFRYVVTGSGTKTVHFKLDGKELASDTVTASGATTNKNIPTGDLSHGAHHLEVWAERELTVNGDIVVLRSKPLDFDLMIVEPEAERPIIAVEYPSDGEIEQYQTITIPYAVYSPNSVKSDVDIYVNGVLYQSANVDRSRQLLSCRAKNHGQIEFSFRVNHVSRIVRVNVVPAAVQVEAESDALALHLSSSGRTNAASNADDWSFTDENGVTTKAQFRNCAFDDASGWHIGKDGLVSLRLQKGAQCYIPLAIFAKDCKTTGKTIMMDFEASDCYDDAATIISCMAGNVGFNVSPMECLFSSALKQTVGTKFKQLERMSVAFVVEEVSGNRFMKLYVDGKMSGVIQYDTSDYFVQNNPVGITLGHSACVLDFHNIRVYDKALSDRQIVNTYIADMDDTDLMFKKLAENNIFNEDSDGDIDYDKAVALIPCMTIIGELPKFKGDKKKGLKLIYEDRQHPEYSFTCESIQIDVQGTSSQYYARKNWKIKFLIAILYTLNQLSAKKYALRCVDSSGEEVKQKAVKTFCLKADFAESSGTHNTGAANFIHEILSKAGILTPPQVVDPTVRTTIYGHPILLFWQADEQSPRIFQGKYNFNNDKSTQETFGFENIDGFNKGMVNRDDYLVWNGTLAELQGHESALAAAQDGEDYLLYLIEKDGDPMLNHLVEYDATAGAWKDKGELWRWDHDLKGWKNRAGASFTDPMPKVADGYLVENEVECWEFLNNGHPMCLFHTSDYESRVYGSDLPKWLDTDWLPVDEDGNRYGPYWAGAFEPRYPDNDDNNKQYAKGKIPKLLKMATDWLSSVNALADGISEDERARRDAEFKAKFGTLFNLNMALSYDSIREFLLMADQGAKNMMWVYFRGQWYLIFYDNDTILGINNEGRIIFIAYVEPHSKDSLGKYVFNGESSVLWNMIERNFSAEKSAMYHKLVTEGGMTYERALYWFNTTESDMWSESIYNADGKFKYIDTFGVAGEGDGLAQNYLDIAQGSREAHRKYMLSERSAYLASKYCTGTYRTNYVYLRANTAGSSSVPSKVELHLTAAQDWYFGFRFSGNAGYSSQFVAKGATARFSAPDGSNPNDTECYVHQADRIKSLGDLSILYPTTLLVTQCTMIEDLTVGNLAKGYIGKLATLTLGTHPLLKKINIANCPNLQSSLGVTGCSALEEIEARGSAITAVNLPVASVIKKMALPATIVQVLMEQLPNLTYDNLSLDGYSHIQTVSIVSCPKLDSVKILEDIMNTTDNSLQYVKLTDINLQGDGRVLLELLDAGIRGADNKNGKPEIYGQYTLTKILPTEDVQRIIDPDNGIVGLYVTTGLYAFIDRIDEINAESYDGISEVEDVSFDNIADHMLYYNGETYQEHVARLAEENRSIHDIINI